MLTRLYSQVTCLSTVPDPDAIVGDLVAHLNDMTRNMKATSEAYREGRILSFIGNWDEDKRRARKLCFNILSKLGYLVERLTADDRHFVKLAMKRMSAAWIDLNEIMKVKSKRFVSDNGEEESDEFGCWQTRLAQAILSLEDRADYSAPDTYLVLLCYKQIKTLLADAILDIQIQQKNETNVKPKPFPFDKLMYISDEDVCLDCAKCMQMIDSFRRDATTIIHSSYANAKLKDDSLSCPPAPPSCMQI